MGGMLSRRRRGAEGAHGRETAPREPVQIHEGGISCISCTRQPGALLATGGADGRICLSDFGEMPPARRRALEGHERSPTQLVYGGGDVLASASRDKTVRLWSLGNPSQTPAVLAGHDMAVMGLALSTGSRSCDVFVWDVGTRSILQRNHTNQNVVTSMKWIRDTKTFIQASEDKALRVWNMDSLAAPVSTFPLQKFIHTSCDVSQDGDYFLTGSNGFNGHGCHVTLWDRRTQKKMADLAGHSQNVSGCAFLKVSGRDCVVSCSSDGSVRLWDTMLGERPCLDVATSSSSGAPTCLTVGRDADLQQFVAVGTVSGYVNMYRIKETGDGGLRLLGQ